MRTLLIITKCLPLACLTSCAQVTTNSDAVWITHIICATILLLSIVLSILICVLRWKQNRSRKKEKEAERKHETDLMDKQSKVKKEEEIKLYRSQLTNFLELLAKGINKEKDKELTFNPQLCDIYINELKSLINDLKPSATSTTVSNSMLPSGLIPEPNPKQDSNPDPIQENDRE